MKPLSIIFATLPLIAFLGLACRDPGSDPKKPEAEILPLESIDQVVSRYVTGWADLDEGVLLGLMQFQTPEDRAALVDWFKEMEPLKAYLLAGKRPDQPKNTFRVSVRHKAAHVVATYLVPVRDGYFPRRFTVVKVDGQPRIQYDAMELSPTPTHLSAAQSSTNKLKKKLRAWQDAESDGLRDMATDFREGLQDQIAAIALAREKALPLVNGYGTIEERERILDQIRSLSDTELRDFVVGRLERDLARVGPESQPSDAPTRPS